jgi:EspG family
MTTPLGATKLCLVQSLLVFGFTLDPIELSVLRQAHGVRSRLFPLRLGNTIADPVKLAALSEAVDDALDRRDLAEDGVLTEPVNTALELLAEHRVAVSITGAGALPGQELTVLAVSDGTQALTVTQRSDDGLLFALFPDGELVTTVASVLPPAEAATGEPVVVGRESFLGADRLARELAGPRLGGGLLVASGRGKRGMWADMLGWVDTAAGRHLVRTAGDRSGNFAARYDPAGPAELKAAIEELLGPSR